MRLYTEGDLLDIPPEQANRLLALGLAFPNEPVLGIPVDDELRMCVVYAYPGDSSEDFPFVADRWMAQLGGQWMAVADWEDETAWFEETPAEGLPTPRVRDITDPPTGTLVYRDFTGQEFIRECT